MINKETLKFFLSLRDHSVYVIYSDFEYEKRARMVYYLKNEKEMPIREKQQHIQDSINKTKKEKKRKAAIDQI